MKNKHKIKMTRENKKHYAEIDYLTGKKRIYKGAE